MKKLGKATLNVTTVGGQKKEYSSAVYEVNLRTSDGKVVKVTAYELPEITGQTSALPRGVIEKLFPNFDPDVLMRGMI